LLTGLRELAGSEVDTFRKGNTVISFLEGAGRRRLHVSDCSVSLCAVVFIQPSFRTKENLQNSRSPLPPFLSLKLLVLQISLRAVFVLSGRLAACPGVLLDGLSSLREPQSLRRIITRWCASNVAGCTSSGTRHCLVFSAGTIAYVEKTRQLANISPRVTG
jgi:hypothetical protein